MSKLTTHAMTVALRDLDPSPSELTEAERRRADDTFARVVATPADDRAVAVALPERRRWWRLLVPVGLLGAVGVAMSGLLLGGSAFASWTPTPESLTPTETSAAAATCRSNFGFPENGEATLLAEQRGKWTYVLISGPRVEASCMMRNELVGQDSGGHGVMGNYDPDPGIAPTVARDDIVEFVSTQSSIDEGWLRDDSWLSWTQGFVGSDVTGVTVHTPLGFDVQASVAHGRFAAWWPSDPPSSKNLDVMGAWSYTVTLADGSTRQSTG